MVDAAVGAGMITFILLASTIFFSLSLILWSAKEVANQLRKLYMGSLEDDEEKAQMMTPEELMKVSNTSQQK